MVTLACSDNLVAFSVMALLTQTAFQVSQIQQVQGGQENHGSLPLQRDQQLSISMCLLGSKHLSLLTVNP